jgi:hypothetical protein
LFLDGFRSPVTARLEILADVGQPGGNIGVAKRRRPQSDWRALAGRSLENAGDRVSDQF